MYKFHSHFNIQLALVTLPAHIISVMAGAMRQEDTTQKNVDTMEGTVVQLVALWVHMTVQQRLTVWIRTVGALLQVLYVLNNRHN